MLLRNLMIWGCDDQHGIIEERREVQRVVFNGAEKAAVQPAGSDPVFDVTICSIGQLDFHLGKLIREFLYDRSRYMTVTGQKIEGSTDIVAVDDIGYDSSCFPKRNGASKMSMQKIEVL